MLLEILLHMVVQFCSQMQPCPKDKSLVPIESFLGGDELAQEHIRTSD